MSSLILLCSESVLANQTCKLNGQPVSLSDGNSTQGKTGIVRCYDVDSNLLTREEEFRNGREEGLMRYYEKGKLVKEFSVNAKGNKHGRSREFTENGLVLLEEYYNNSDRTGLVRKFYPNGQIRRISAHVPSQGEQAFAEFTSQNQLAELNCGNEPWLTPVVDDRKLCGFSGRSSVELFKENGRKWAVNEYELGKRVRQEILFDNGKPEIISETQGNTTIKRTISKDGVKRKEETRKEGRDGGILREQEFSERGSLTLERQWLDHQLVMENTFYLNGQPHTQEKYTTQDGKRILTSSTYHDNGKLASEGSYSESGRYGRSAIGTHKRYNPQGILIAEYSYDNKGHLMRERVWNEKGTLLRDDEVFEDSSRKAYTR